MAASPLLAAELSRELAPGAYVTDGYHLFAILSVSPAAHSDRVVTYEDCHTLELLACSLGELERRHLKLVRSGGDEATL